MDRQGFAKDPRSSTFLRLGVPAQRPPPPCVEQPATTGIPLEAHIASRGDTIRVRKKVGNASTAALLTQLLLVDEEGDLGWMFALHGSVTFEEKAGSEERPIKIKVKVAADNGLTASSSSRATTSSRSRAARRRPCSSRSRRHSRRPRSGGRLPDAKGTRLEFGDYSFTVDISKDGFKINASTKKSALVLSSGDADAFVEESSALQSGGSSSTSA